MSLDSAYFELQAYAWDGRAAGLGTGSASAQVPITAAAYRYEFSAGAGALQFNTAYAKARTLPGSTEDVDLSGVLLDTFGATIAAAEVKMWAVRNTSASNTLTVGGTGGSYWTTCLNGTVTLPPGGLMAFAASDATGWTVAAGTGDLLHLAGTSGQGYELIFWSN